MLLHRRTKDKITKYIELQFKETLIRENFKRKFLERKLCTMLNCYYDNLTLITCSLIIKS
jgi:hypothetical protein